MNIDAQKYFQAVREQRDERSDSEAQYRALSMALKGRVEELEAEVAELKERVGETDEAEMPEQPAGESAETTAEN